MQDGFLRFDGLIAPIRIIGCEELLADFPQYFPGWAYNVSDPDDQSPFATLIGTERNFHLSAIDKKPAVYKTAVNAVCDLMAVIAQQIPRENPDQLCLHAAAAKIGEGLIVFPATRRAGKSTLMATLAASGVPIFGDDILPVTTTAGQPLSGLAGGTSLRLRLPLPPTVPQSITDYMQRNPGPENRQYRYVPSNEVVPHNEHSQVTAFVHLDRVDDGPASLEPMSRGVMLKSLMKQNFARDGTAQHILSALYELAENTTSWTLTYSDLSEACELLMDAFKQSKPTELVAKPVSNPAESVILPALLDPDTPIGRHPEASMIALDGEAFVATRDMTRIMHANEGIQRIWALLEEPTSRNEAVDILCAAFPEEDPDRLAQDTAEAFAQLGEYGLTAFESD